MSENNIYYYTAATILLAVLMVAMIVHVLTYSGFNKRQKGWFILTFGTIIFCSLAEFALHCGYYDEIFKEFIHECNDELNIIEGIIETPRPLNKDLIKQLEEVLSKDGKVVELKEKINKSLISGFKITIDNHVIDNSLKNKINDLKDTLLRKEGGLWN